jgi:alpha-galactosidase
MIGAGSAGFCRNLIQDCLTYESLQNAHFVLMDIDAERLETTHRVMERMKIQHGLKCAFSATTDRREALREADFAISMIQVGGLEPYKIDIEIPQKYGIDQCVGDTLNPGGVFRGLRHVAAFMEILRDMEEVCPNVLFMNYANPMAICTWAMQKAFPHIQTVGLCHGVQHTTKMLCDWLGLPVDECEALTAGINHMAWFLRLEHKGRDLYPDLWKRLTEDGPIKGEDYRFEMMKATGYFMTESSGHLSEYLPYFRHSKETQNLFSGPGFAGETAAYLKGCLAGFKDYTRQMALWANGEEPVPLDTETKSVEFASEIMNARLTGRICRFAGNTLNKGYITNLPPDCCVEVPVFVDRQGMHGSHVGALPDQCAALCQSNIAVQRLAVTAALEGDPEAVYHACLLDPLTAATLPPHKIRPMVEEMLEAQAAWLPQFKNLKSMTPGAELVRRFGAIPSRERGSELKVRIGHYDKE